MERVKRAVSLVLCLVMVLGFLPVSAFAATADDALTAALSEAQSYIDGITVNSSSNDPETVVKNFKTHFTWDNEKRESSQSYLFDWSYYNGVVFEGLEYLYEVTGKEDYKDYVLEYMSSLIAGDGTWAKCSNNSSKECAGYNATHGADCYKTASLLLDAYELSGDGRYLTMANTLYADLDSAAAKYSLSECGGNYRHTWASDPSPDLWLDGLYMILPFRAEYAKHVGDTEELDLIVSRMQWVSDNMYDSTKGLFYHAADSATSNSGTYWLRSIGWYAAAIVDVMDSMDGENLETMKAQLVKLVDGMKACQNASNGMWLNDLNSNQSSANPYETSGTALVCYAVMKAVNNGWLDESYADMALLAFKGICEEKLDGDNLTDICFKGAPGSSNSTFYDNEGKGVGPFIMLTAEVLEYVSTEEEPEEPEETVPETTVPTETEPVPVIKTDDETGVSVEAVGITGLNVAPVAVEEMAEAVAEVLTGTLVAYDITVKNFTEGSTAAVTVAIPEGVNADNFAVFYVSAKGDLERMEGEAAEDGKTYNFYTTHFSTYVGGEVRAAAEEPADAVTGEGYLPGEKVYTLDTDGITANENYLIVNTNSGTGYALTNNNGTVGGTAVTISNSKITVEDDANIAWQFSGTTSGTVGNNGRYVYPNNGSLSLNTSGTNLSISSQGSGAYRIYRYSSYYYYYLRYNNAWTGSRTYRESSVGSVYLYELTGSTNGAAVTFTVTPGALNLVVDDTAEQGYTITLSDGTDVISSEIEWATGDSRVATVSNGKVTGVADGTTNITATLSAVNGKPLQENIVLTIPVTVQSKKVVSFVLTGNDPVSTVIGTEPDFSNIELIITYDDRTTEEIPASELTITGYDKDTLGNYIADISYQGKSRGSVAVSVCPNYPTTPAPEPYPQYPNDGAVRIDKTATSNAAEFERTGVTRVELDVAGISVKSAIDVLLIMDISNSMSWDDTEYNYADATVTAGTNQRLNIAKASAKEFVNTLLKDDGSGVNNSVTLLAFAGIDGDHNTHSTAKDNDDVYQVGKTAMTSIDDAEDAIDSLVKATTGGTNYDYAFQQAYDLIQEINEARGNDVYVVFMTDGVPTHYNGVYYKSRSNTDLTACMQYVDPVTGETSSYTSTGNDRNGKDIDVTATQNITVYYNDGTTRTKNVTYNKGWSDYVTGNQNGWVNKVKGLDSLAKIYSIGFGMKNGSVTQGATSSMPTLDNVNGGQYYIPSSTTRTVLEQIASTPDDYHEADNEDELKALYSNIATKIRYAGTQAQVTDVVHENFTLQTTQTVFSYENQAGELVNIDLATPPSISVTIRDLYPRGTKNEAGEDITGGIIPNTEKTIEKVTFGPDGTTAYSDQIGVSNIMTYVDEDNFTIVAKNFIYTKVDGIETFQWLIGNITDKEVTLAYDAYLKGSLEGERDKGVYDTNEVAYLEYIDINGKYAKQYFPVPAEVWGGASTTIRFYLVDHEGYPVNRDGVRVPWENRIYAGEPVVIPLNLNADATIEAQKIEAAAYVPAQYFLYDVNAYYTVKTSSSVDGVEPGINVSAPSEDATKTTGTAPNQVTQTGAQTTRVISFEDPNYTWSYVGFGIRWDLTSEKVEAPLVSDRVVIDYGKAIDVDVMDNDPGREGYSTELVGFVKYDAKADLEYIQQNPGSATFTTDNGTFSIQDGKVRYQLQRMLSEIERVFYVVKYTEQVNAQNIYYLFGQLDIYPATIVYYETDFADVFTTSADWDVVDDAFGKDGPQNDGSVGIGNDYGFDSTYANDRFLSDGHSHFVHGQGISATTVAFTFTGTGFEIISRTGVEQGTIKVMVYDKDQELVKSVSVLNKSEGENQFELYQIPVVSINDLDYGTYTVNIGVMAGYKNETGNPAYDVLNRGDEFYFDAVRVFNPLEGNAEAHAVYAEDGEADPINLEIRQQVLNAGAFDCVDFETEFEINGAVFVDRGPNDTADLGTYEAIGPNNELYLAKNQGVAFRISDIRNPASIDIGAKSVTGAEAALNVILYDANENQVSRIAGRPVATSTAQNYAVYDDEHSGVSGSAYMVIWNTGDGVLSLTDLKIAYRELIEEPAAVSFMVNRSVMRMAVAAVSEQPETPEEPEIPVVPEEPEVPEVTPNYDILSAEFTSSRFRILRTATMEVVTTQDVEYLRVTNLLGLNADASISNPVDNADGTRTWRVTVLPLLIGIHKYTVTGYGANGTCGASASNTIWVNLL